MNKWILILFMLSAFLMFQSCNTEKKNVGDEIKINNQSDKQNNLIYENGDLYCVVGDTVIIFDIVAGEIKWDIGIRRSYHFGLVLVFRKNKPGDQDYYFSLKRSFGLDSNQFFYFNPKIITIEDACLSIVDERNEEHFECLFWSNSYKSIPNKNRYEKEYQWRYDNRDSINYWESNPIREMDTMISYVDLNKNICRVSSGYKGRINGGLSMSYPFNEPLTATIEEVDTIITMGYPEVTSKKIKSVPIVDTRKYKNFDYICVTYKGLEALAIDLQKTIEPTQYPIILTLK